MTDNPRIYVACLSSYNAGRLHGAWIDADQSADAIEEAINAMLRKSPSPDAEEWAIHDYDDMPNLGENPDLETVAAFGEAVAEHGHDIVKAALDVGAPLDDTIGDWIADNYRGTYESTEDFAYELLEDTGDLKSIPEHLQSYFDHESYARDLMLSGDFSFIRLRSGVVAVFSNV